MAFRVQGFADALSHQSIRAIIIILTALILHRFTLNLEFFLRNCVQQETHPICFQPQHLFQLVRGYGLIVIGPIGTGGAI